MTLSFRKKTDNEANSLLWSPIVFGKTLWWIVPFCFCTIVRPQLWKQINNVKENLSLLEKYLNMAALKSTEFTFSSFCSLCTHECTDDYFDTKGTLKCDDSQASSSWFDRIMSQIVALVVLNYLNCLRLTLIHLLHLPLCATSDPQNLCTVFKLKIKSNCFKWKIASSPLDPQNGAPPC